MTAGHGGWVSGVLAAVLTLSAVPLARAEVPVSENANRRFTQGVRYLTSQDPGRYEKAYREFKAAYEDSPSWKILGNLGIAAHELERDGEAIEAFKAYLARGGKDLAADERKQFKDDLDVLEHGYSTVTIETVPDGAWLIDERLPETGAPIVNRYGPTEGKLVLRVRAGHHRLRAEVSGYESDTWEFSDPPGGSSSHRFELRSANATVSEPGPPVEAPIDARLDSDPGSPGLRTASYVAWGVGAVGVGLGTWFMLDGFDKRSHADDVFAECSAQVPGCPVGAPLHDSAVTAQDDEGSAFTRSLVSYVAGGAFIATGVVLFVVSSPDDERRPSDEARIVPWVSPTSVGLSGRF